jgi:hypothetical protein
MLPGGQAPGPCFARHSAEQPQAAKKAKLPPALPNEVTLCLRGLPTELAPLDVLAQLAPWREEVDFFYLPTNFESRRNLGFAFANFCSQQAADRFVEQWHGEAKPARVQGWRANVDRLMRGQALDGLAPELRPRVFLRGHEVPFPTLEQWCAEHGEEAVQKKEHGKTKDWTCSVCHANCFVSKKKCFKCGAPKPKA